jgi:Cu(I)/Ag(I) efflux system membrane fusion protein
MHDQWLAVHGPLVEQGEVLTAASDLESVRAGFQRITGLMTALVKRFRPGKGPVYRFHCPMAFGNEGAYWLQNHDSPRNPYYGSAMLTCQDSVEILVPADENE